MRLFFYPCNIQVSLTLPPCSCFGFECLYSDTLTESAAVSSGRELGPDVEIIKQRRWFSFLTPTMQHPKGGDMLSWSFIVMQRDEARSQTA